MALVSGRSSLNPNAPLFIPAVFRQVEDFSTEWWNLITTSTWFHDYWLSQNSEEEIFSGHEAHDTDDKDITDLLPDTFDLGVDDFLEAHFEDFIQSSETEGNISPIPSPKVENGSGMDVATMMKNLTIAKSPRERGPRYAISTAVYQEKHVKGVSPKCSPRQIHQPR